MKAVIIIAIVGAIVLLISKSNKPLPTKRNVVYQNNDTFIYDILYADAPLDQVENKGIVTKDQFTTVFENFPWIDQIRLSNQIKIQSPTLSIHDNKLKQTIFISMSGDPDNKNMGIGYVIGLIKSQGNDKKDTGVIRITKDKVLVENLISSFFDRDSNFESVITNIK
jgi:hypothetical protein